MSKEANRDRKRLPAAQSQMALQILKQNHLQNAGHNPHKLHCFTKREVYSSSFEGGYRIMWTMVGPNIVFVLRIVHHSAYDHLSQVSQASLASGATFSGSATLANNITKGDEGACRNVYGFLDRSPLPQSR